MVLQQNKASLHPHKVTCWILVKRFKSILSEAILHPVHVHQEQLARSHKQYTLHKYINKCIHKYISTMSPWAIWAAFKSNVTNNKILSTVHFKLWKCYHQLYKFRCVKKGRWQRGWGEAGWMAKSYLQLTYTHKPKLILPNYLDNSSALRFYKTKVTETRNSTAMENSTLPILKIGSLI